ncbi:hypothetical protein [Acinetobacter sp. WCHAc010052]|uniref:hypothetical protein n=1 Tax=Acinetobacter sp. WCHAc010052 TaxID=2004647 RepID=UPI000B3D3666|nr:hypothetical protein [Acinetobacter sp. WCHAc010052]AXY61275.1 hypothetical protein CDG61_15420 [Acinetobacter sp. WCHAc010052]
MTIKHLSLAVIMGSMIALSACGKKNSEPTEDIRPEDKVMQELASGPVKEFPQTADDQHDIAQLSDYDDRFTQMSDEMEDEIMKMKDAGTLTPEFAYERKRDNVRSALSMLKELELKTEQGRYIQGLMANYWENQFRILEQHKNDAETTTVKDEEKVKGLGDFIQAQEQLEAWRAKYPETAQNPS